LQSIEKYEELLNPDYLWRLFTGRDDANPLVTTGELSSAGGAVDDILLYENLGIDLEDPNASWADQAQAELPPRPARSAAEAASARARTEESMFSEEVAAVEFDLEQ